MRPFFASVRNDCLHSPSAQQLSGLLPEIKWLLWCEDSGGPRPLSCCSSVAVGLCPLNVISMLMKFKKYVDQVQVANCLEIMNFHIKVWFKAQLRPAPVWRVSWAGQWWVRGVLCCLFISRVMQLWLPIHRYTVFREDITHAFTIWESIKALL